MANFRQGTELQSVHIADSDPTVAPGVSGATPNMMLVRRDNNTLYYFKGPLDTDWEPFAGVGSPAPVNTIVFRPNAPSPFPENVYDTWAGAYAALQSVAGAGLVYLEFDARFSLTTRDAAGGSGLQPSCIIPPGVWNMTNVIWTNTARTSLANPIMVVVASDGASFVIDTTFNPMNTLRIEGYGMAVLLDRFGLTPQFFGINLMLDGSLVRLYNLTAGTLPGIVGDGINNTIVFTGRCTFGQIRGRSQTVDALIDCNGGQIGLNFGAGAVRNGSITDLAGGGFLLVINYDDSSNALFANSIAMQFPGFVAGGGVFLDPGANHRDRHSVVVDGIVTDPDYDATLNELVMVDTSLNPVAVLAPPASPVLGERFTVKDVGGNAAVNNITISPIAPNTIESGLISTALGCKTWVCDGSIPGNWMLISST